MSMYKEIIYKDKKYCFKCSAGTDILFKRMFMFGSIPMTAAL